MLCEEGEGGESRPFCSLLVRSLLLLFFFPLSLPSPWVCRGVQYCELQDFVAIIMARGK